LIKALFGLGLLAVPLLVITALPRLFELAGSIPATAREAASTAPAPAFRLIDATPTPTRKFAPLEDGPPPTLSPPVATPAPAGTPRPTPTGERIVIGNTGGRGAVLRTEPVTGRAVAALREQQVLDVLERRNVPGGGDWVHVRTSEGAEGWVTGLVALPLVANR
jgi:hypothetical protein